MKNFINRSKISSKSRYGFRSGHSTENALINIVNYLSSSLDHFTFLFALYLGIPKALDSINHYILLDKLYLNGFRGNSRLIP